MSQVKTAGSALAEIGSIPRDGDEPVFPAPWAATAFALTVALHERGHFIWSEWADRLGRAIKDEGEDVDDNPEAYWRCWLAALEETVYASGIGSAEILDALRAAWREAATVTPHGEPIVLSDRVKYLLSGHI